MPHVERTFRVAGDPTDALVRAGWTVDRDGDDLVAEHGSTLRTRILGGWFVKEATLPKRLRATRDGDGYEIRAEDRIGFGIFDPKLGRRYERAFDGLERDLTSR